jgi:S-methylmethionine-dependent homocysteine/selenocysteine methylase
VNVYRQRLPQLDGGVFLTDGGIETMLTFHHGLELPLFAAFDLLKDDDGTEALRRYYATYAALAREHGVGFVLESPTWRASPGWATQLGYSDEELDALNRKAIALMEEIRAEYQANAPIVISGCIGPEGDGYAPDTMLTADEAERHHAVQIGTFADTAADMVTAITMTYAEEATGLTRAAVNAELDEVDEGDPGDLAARHAELNALLPAVNVLGGCCGTDHRHVGAICTAWLA